MTEIEVFPSPEEVARMVAGELTQRLASVQAQGREPHLALTGGGIARRIYQAVAASTREGAAGSPAVAVDWSRVQFWWGDERYVAADSSDRNDVMARSAFLDAVGADPKKVHPMPADDGSHADLESAAEAYGSELRQAGGERFDVVLLGLGPDGHVASLFPGQPQVHVEDRIAVGVTDSPKPPPQRISLTMPCLNRADEVWFVVSGEEKAEAVARTLAPEGTDSATPARGITASRRWFLDVAAASRI